MPVAIRLFSPAKACSAWSSDDMNLCKARVIDADASSFFSSPPQSSSTGLPQLDQKFVDQLHAVMQARAPAEEEVAILNFASTLLKLLGFTQPSETTQVVTTDARFTDHLEQEGTRARRLIRRNYDLPLFMGGRTTGALADLCIVQSHSPSPNPDEDTILLLVKALPPSSITPPSSPVDGKVNEAPINTDPISCVEAQLLAQAIASFQQHNRLHRRQRLPPIEVKVVPALLMIGTQPILYKIEITADLVECIQSDRMPACTTKMNRFILGDIGSVGGGVDGIQDGRECFGAMVPDDNRKKILKGLSAFKACL